MEMAGQKSSPSKIFIQNKLSSKSLVVKWKWLGRKARLRRSSFKTSCLQNHWWLKRMAGQKSSPSKIFIQNKVSSKSFVVKKNGWAEKLAFKDLHSKQVVFKNIGF